MNPHMFCRVIAFILASVFFIAGGFHAFAEQQPNILWITIEDWGPDLSCYGTKGIATPHIDKLAAEGVRYETAFSTAPVCSPSRSAMMTGFHQNYIGAHQHRTYDKKPLPHGIRPIPHLLAEAGYFTCLMSWKTDCNFLPDKRHELFMGKDWNQRQPDQPFFARISFQGTHRAWSRDPKRPINIQDVEIPPYYADTSFLRRDWANGLEQMQLVDREVGELLQRLDREGLADNTLVFFTADHGRCHIRGKQFLYEGGLQVPLVMRWPEKISPKQVSRDLVMTLDICATVLDAAGITPSIKLHGESLLGNAISKRKYVFAARDKMDSTHDAMRSIRSKNHKLILNLMPERAYCQYNFYKEASYPPLAEMNVLHLEGKLTPEQAAFMAPSKPRIELFDLRKDPFEIHNVAEEPDYAHVKMELLAELDTWRKKVIHDQGVSDDFRAEGIYPTVCPTSTVGEWVDRNLTNQEAIAHGMPRWYPTRTLAEWKKVRAKWKPYVFRDVSDEMARPKIPFTKSPK